jgi:hypothetical protein
MSLTAGFGLGAGVAGVLAEWAPVPTALTYLVNAAMALAAAAVLVRAPETRPRQHTGGARTGSWWADLAIPASARRRFLFVVLPIAPWVFGAAGAAYAVLPALVTTHTGGAPIAFSALLCVVTLGVGFAVQQVGRYLGADGLRGVVVALLLLVLGMGCAAWAAATLTIGVALIAAAVLGAAYGMALLAGLQEIQRLAGPDDLAGLTAVFYSLSYLGFGVPAVLAYLSTVGATYPEMFGAGALAALMCLAVALAGARRNPSVS